MRGLKKKNLEFISASKRKGAWYSMFHSRRWVFWCLPVLGACLFLALLLTFTYQTAVLQGETDELISIIDREEIVLVKERLEVLEETVETYRNMKQELEEQQPILDELKDANGDDVLAVYGLAEASLDIQKLVCEDGVIKITAVSEFYTDGSLYAMELENSDRFEMVTYHGFTTSNDAGEHPVCQFLISVKLRRDES